ncbi:MAG: hypothetical protein ACREDJ_10480 [Methylocella sp.]
MRQNIEWGFLCGAGCLELGHELRSAVDLDGFDGVRHCGEDRGRGSRRRFSRWPSVRSRDGPFGLRIAGVEVFDGASGSGRDGERVDLHDVAGAGLAAALRMSAGTFATAPRRINSPAMRPTVASPAANPCLRGIGPSFGLPHIG